jgi:hypothetical protein
MLASGQLRLPRDRVDGVGVVLERVDVAGDVFLSATTTMRYFDSRVTMTAGPGEECWCLLPVAGGCRCSTSAMESSSAVTGVNRVIAAQRR